MPTFELNHETRGPGVERAGDPGTGRREVEPARRVIIMPVVHRLFVGWVADESVHGETRHHSGSGGTSGSICAINGGRSSCTVCQTLSSRMAK